MENQDNRTKPHKTAQEGGENRIQSVSPGVDRTLWPAFDANGKRIPKVYYRVLKDGSRTYYARIPNPETGRETMQSSPDGSVAMAKALVTNAKRAVGEARVNAYREALGAIQRRSDGWTIGRALETYRRVAPGHFAVLSTGGRRRGGGLKHSLWSMEEVFKDAMEKPISEAPRILAAWVEARVLAGTRLPSVVGMAKQAKSLFARWALDAFADEGCKVPELRWRALPADGYQYELPPQELRERTIAAGKEEVAKGSDIGRAFLLEFFCAMSAADSCRARWDWLDAGGTVHYVRAKTGKNADPRLSPDVAQRWSELAGAEAGHQDFVIPRRTEGERREFVLKEFSQWMRSLGWTGPKTGHELRKLMCSIWYTTPGIGAEWTQAWSGDSLEVLQKHYARLLPEKAPPAPSV